MNIDLYKRIQLSNEDDFLHMIKFIKPHHVDETAKRLIDDRLSRIGYQLEYGCCGVNHFKKLHRREL